ncbi:NAD(P)/FAD-dependent oxidoreductase [Pseudodonghicola flavimaris]|uniref:FAD-binding oxidoreductase n=1 Tax=Pseudodonghicola flavimaris TaxID=3050036 RepID=A0ABT7F6F1_9RHOB|nr:FAD-binding oxidoreductase [Pseudodonghicola flavimaris]MDK3020190.1 FAD-binding oxidoreductase [Pseudodonghicola flavimaris]
MSNAKAEGAQVIVVGGGVTGLSTAFWLAEAGVDVLVLERGLVGWEASGRNGGGCSHHHSPLFPEEQRLWPVMDDLLGYPTEFRPDRIRIALNPTQYELYSRAVVNARHQGFAVDELDAQQVRDLVPLAGETAYAGHYYRFGGHANPHRTVQAYAWAIRDRGGRVMQHVAVTGFVTEGDRVTGVETDRGRFGCDHLVIAAGPQTARLAARLEVHIPMRSARAEMIVTEPLPLMPLGGIDGNGLYGRQTLRGNLAYGGGPHEWVETEALPDRDRPATPLAGHIARRLAELLPKAAHARVIRSWAGLIENTPDGRPVLDRPAPWSNLTVGSLSGVGFGLSPASGRALMQLVTAGRCDFADLSSLRLDRFSDLEPDWAALQGWLPAAALAV